MEHAIALAGLWFSGFAVIDCLVLAIVNDASPASSTRHT